MKIVKFKYGKNNYTGILYDDSGNIKRILFNHPKGWDISKFNEFSDIYNRNVKKLANKLNFKTGLLINRRLVDDIKIIKQNEYHGLSKAL